MKNIKVSSNLLDLVKKGVCTLITTILIAVPHTGITEETKEDYRVPTKIEQQLSTKEDSLKEILNEDETDIELIINNQSIKTKINSNNPEDISLDEILYSLDGSQTIEELPSFTIVTCWEQTENYRASLFASIDNREYKRTTYKVKLNENINMEEFGNDIESMIKYFRTNEKGSGIFEIVDSQEEVITVDYKEESELEIKEDLVQIDGTNLSFKVKVKEDIDYGKVKSRITRTGLLVFYIIIAAGVIKNRKRLG